MLALLEEFCRDPGGSVEGFVTGIRETRVEGGYPSVQGAVAALQLAIVAALNSRMVERQMR